MFTARSARPSAISRAASSEPPQIRQLASCIPSKIGLSSVPSPCAKSSPFSGAARTASRYDGTCTRSSSASGAGSGSRRSHPLQHPKLAGQPHGQVETDRVQRVIRVEPLGEELRCPHHRSSRAHAGKLSDPAAARRSRRSPQRPPFGSQPCSGGERGRASPCCPPLTMTTLAPFTVTMKGGLGDTLVCCAGHAAAGPQRRSHVEAPLLPELTRRGCPQSVRSQTSTASLQKPTVGMSVSGRPGPWRASTMCLGLPRGIPHGEGPPMCTGNGRSDRLSPPSIWRVRPTSLARDVDGGRVDGPSRAAHRSHG